MTNRQRIIDTLLGQPTDRAPYGIGLGFYPWGETIQRWRQESGLADLDPAAYFAYDPGFQVVPLEYGPLPHFEYQILQEDAQFIIARDWRGIVMKNRRDGGSMPDFISHPIRSADDWQRYKNERLQPRLAQRLAKVDDYVQRLAAIDAPRQLGVFPWGVFGTARDLLGAEELLLAFYDHPDMVRDIMATLVEGWLSLYEAVAQHSISIDHIHIWEDMSGRQGSLISLTMVEEFMMPQYDRIVAFARRRGIPVVSVDTDGRCDQLVPVMMAHGINMFFPFEVAAGNDIEWFRRAYPTLGIIGGLDKRALAAGHAEIHAELDRAERMLAHGRYIPSCDHLIPPDVSWANWKYFNENLRRICGA